jgi:hypothetical protein
MKSSITPSRTFGIRLSIIALFKRRAGESFRSASGRSRTAGPVFFRALSPVGLDPRSTSLPELHSPTITTQRIGHRCGPFCHARCPLLSTASPLHQSITICVGTADPQNYHHRAQTSGPDLLGLGGWRRDRGLLFAGKERRNIPRPGQEKN